jgi:hypothetical protein
VDCAYEKTLFVIKQITWHGGDMPGDHQGGNHHFFTQNGVRPEDLLVEDTPNTNKSSVSCTEIYWIIIQLSLKID